MSGTIPTVPNRYVKTDGTGDPSVAGLAESAHLDALAASAADGREYLYAPVYCASRAAIKALDPTKDPVAFLTETEGRAGIFRTILLSTLSFDERSIAAMDSGNLGGIYLVSTTNSLYVYKRVFSGRHDIRWWGAVVGDYGVNNSAAIQAAHDALPGSGGEIYVPHADGSDGAFSESARWAFATTLTLTKPVTLRGDGRYASVLFWNGPIHTLAIEAGVYGLTVQSLAIRGDFGAPFNGMVSQAYDPPSIANNMAHSVTLPLAGAAAGMIVTNINFSIPLSGLVLTAMVTNGSVIFTFTNNTGAAVDLGSGTLSAEVNTPTVTMAGLNPSTIASGSSFVQDITVNGVVAGQPVEAEFSASLFGLVLTAKSLSGGIVRCTFENNTGASVDLVSGDLRVRVGFVYISGSMAIRSLGNLEVINSTVSYFQYCLDYPLSPPYTAGSGGYYHKFIDVWFQRADIHVRNWTSNNTSFIGCKFENARQFVTCNGGSGPLSFTDCAFEAWTGVGIAAVSGAAFSINLKGCYVENYPETYVEAGTGGFGNTYNTGYLISNNGAPIALFGNMISTKGVVRVAVVSNGVPRIFSSGNYFIMFNSAPKNTLTHIYYSSAAFELHAYGDMMFGTAPSGAVYNSPIIRGSGVNPMTSTAIGLNGSKTYDPPSLVNGDSVTTTVAVIGAALGDFADVSFNLDLQGITVSAWVSAANTTSVRFQNETGVTLDLGSGTLAVSVRK